MKNDTPDVVRDDCQVCLGWSGGTPGNENIIDGVIVCDHCTVKIRRFKEHAHPSPE